MRKSVVVASLLVLSIASVAQAEGPQPQPQYQPQPGQPQQGGVQVVEQQPAQAADTRQAGRGIEYGAHLIVPIWTDSTLNLSPGFGVQGRVGWEFPGGLTPELNIGVMFNQWDIGDVLGVSVSTNLTNFWVGGGLRYAFLNPSAFVPFVGAGIALNVWNCSDCTDSSARLTVSFNGLAGFAYEITQQIALEAGVQVNYSLKGEVFADGTTPLWISPFLGGTFYF